MLKRVAERECVAGSWKRVEMNKFGAAKRADFRLRVARDYKELNAVISSEVEAEFM